ncbi:MAG: hypothetical protein E7458_00855 [Ruminococcaceae bacterium]|nr:hypothetical protein [Oscillospiraceae bacterium]
MERGTYIQGWYKNNHCYHPGLPYRSLQMIEELERQHATILVWSAMGGGSISLPYLEHEINGPVDPRLRFYGYMNDREFVAECKKRGINAFGIVFEVQGWEFPAVIDEETGEFKRLNLHAEEDENHGWYGLREFSQNKYANAFPTTLKDYYPDPIINSDGEVVTDLWEEAASRTRTGEPVHARWVEVQGHAQQAYQVCRNNPVWRDYLKKIMMLQIDGGVPGIQLDECELPMTSIGTGGCFCKDCMKQFTQFVKAKKAAGRLGSQWDGIDLDTFNYKDFLNDGGYDYPRADPLFEDYWEFQMYAVREYFSELSDFAKAYAKEKYDRDLMVSGNFYNLNPVYYGIEPKADIIITEMEHSLFRQPHFYRYCAGFAAGKTILIAENPYGGIVPQLVEMLDKGQGYDLYRIFLIEASMYGCNMTVPFGAWMGNVVKDAFCPPRHLTTQVQDFLYENERFYPKTKTKGAAVLYSFGSYYLRDASRGGNGIQDNFDDLSEITSDWNDPDVKHLPFWDVIRELSNQNAMYDVVMMPDDRLRKDDMTLDRIADYPMLVIPDAFEITPNQAEILRAYAAKGGQILIYGRLADGTTLLDELAALPNVRVLPMDEDAEAGIRAFGKLFAEQYAPVASLTCDDTRIGIQRFDDEGKTYVHVLNYSYKTATDHIDILEEVTFTLSDVAKEAKVYTLSGDPMPEMETACENGKVRVTLKNVPLYTVVAFE